MNRFGHYLLVFIRTYLGAFNLASGLNYFILVWPQPIPADANGAAYMSATMHMGLFQFAKVIELVGGLSLTFDLFVPLGLVLLFPISVTVFVMNVFSSPLAHVQVSGGRNFVFHVILLTAYAGNYYPFLAFRGRPAPVWSTWREIPGFIAGSKEETP